MSLRRYEGPARATPYRLEPERGRTEASRNVARVQALRSAGVARAADAGTSRSVGGDPAHAQERLAELAGNYRNYASAVERGERSVSPANMVRIARALGVPLSVLVRGVDGAERT